MISFLAKCKPESIKIGLSFFEAEMKAIPVYEDDIVLDYCVTPKKMLFFLRAFLFRKHFFVKNNKYP